jgi:arylsulfatase A-like enzyme
MSISGWRPAAVDEKRKVPWIASGPGIRRNHRICQPVSILDTAPTVAHLLDISPHYSWGGGLLGEIFVDVHEPPGNTVSYLKANT